MRRYFFSNNPYITGIQTGIQAGHATEVMWANMVERYLEHGREEDKNALRRLISFAREHKTWVILDGGDHDALTELFEFLAQNGNPYEVAAFHEPGLNNTVTSITILLPERMYDLQWRSFSE